MLAYSRNISSVKGCNSVMTCSDSDINDSVSCAFQRCAREIVGAIPEIGKTDKYDIWSSKPQSQLCTSAMLSDIYPICMQHRPTIVC